MKLSRERGDIHRPGICNISGLKIAGVVEEVDTSEEAPGQRKWVKGAEVMGLLYGGGYAV